MEQPGIAGPELESASRRVLVLVGEDRRECQCPEQYREVKGQRMMCQLLLLLPGAA